MIVNRTLAPPVVERLSKLLPRLASTFAGEKLATLDAIERSLKVHNHDWHDVVAALDPKPPIPFEDEPPPYQHRPQERWGRWARLPPNEREMALEAIQRLPRLSDWEERFVASLSETIRGNVYARLTAKQIGVLDRLLARVNAEAQRW